jgi:hypothetical protein
MSAKEPTTTAEVIDDVTRKEHRAAWDRTILGIAVFCGIASWILIYSLFPGRHNVLRIVLATLYVYAIERVLLLLRKGLMTTYETQREIHIAIIGILVLFGVIAVNVVCHFAQQMAGATLSPYLMEYLRWGMVIVPVAVMGLGIYLQSQDPEARRQSLERRERGERAEFKTNARRDALSHPTMVATKTLIAEITAEAMAEEWIDEVRGELPAIVRARLDAKLQTRQQRDNRYAPIPVAPRRTVSALAVTPEDELRGTYASLPVPQTAVPKVVRAEDRRAHNRAEDPKE